jgi:hypothetical protein
MLMRLLLFTGSVLAVLSGPPSPVQAEARHSHAGDASALVGVVEVSTERFEHVSGGGNQEQ